MRMNWLVMRVWSWCADGTVYLLGLVTVTGVYLWYAIRAERRIGFVLLAAGTLSFVVLTYALIH